MAPHHYSHQSNQRSSDETRKNNSLRLTIQKIKNQRLLITQHLANLAALQLRIEALQNHRKDILVLPNLMGSLSISHGRPPVNVAQIKENETISQLTTAVSHILVVTGWLLPEKGNEHHSTSPYNNSPCIYIEKTKSKKNIKKQNPHKKNQKTKKSNKNR